mmetsp:Transcript_11125/g.16844  ORF Transcript_11125/g.16844 Transcript_11125/m.16844 type:complete len:580 (-) Transcript_11125:1586-3325(-)
MSHQHYYAANADQQQPIVVVQGTVVSQQPLPVPSSNHYIGSHVPVSAQPYIAPPPPPSQAAVYVSEDKASNPISDTKNMGIVTPFSVQEEYAHERDRGQSRQYRDVPFAVLFIVHLLVMGFACASNSHKLYGKDAGSNDEGRRLLHGSATFISDYIGSRVLDEDQQEGDAIDPDGFISLLIISGVLAFILSALSLSFMTYFAEGLIKTALIVNVIMYGVMALFGFAVGAAGMGFMGLIMFVFAAWYTFKVWDRIPFAAANLKTAITSIRANIGVTIFGYLSLFVLFGWSIAWAITAIVVLDVSADNMEGNEGGEDEELPEVNGVVLFLLLLSFYWTQQVIKNVVHVTVAGTVGTWWFTPKEANSCCSPAVRDSFVRATTYSFGSICFGSLIVAIIEATREMVRQARESDDGILVCLADCCLGCLESIVEYFNMWAYVFVALYGFGFVEAGKNVIQLFKSRGWTTIITDSLISNVLFLICLGVGVITGLLVDLFMMGPIKNGSIFSEDVSSGSALFIAFVIGFLFGYLWSSVLMGTLSSAVSTVIVCYAEAPTEFDQNHPQLSQEMRATWRQAWPIDFKY